jgi:HEAT repeat protein
MTQTVAALVREIVSGKVIGSALVGLLSSPNSSVRVNAIRALANGYANNKVQAIDALVRHATGVFADERIMGIATEGMLAALALDHMGEVNAAEAVRSNWPERKREDARWLFSKNSSLFELDARTAVQNS